MVSGTAPAKRNPGVQIVLPGSWWKIPVGDVEASKRAIQTLADRITNHVDAFAQLRRDLRTELTELANKARDGGADQLFLALEIVPGATLPMSLALFWPDIDVLGSTPSDPKTVIELVRGALAALPDSGDYGDLEQATLGDTEAWRRSRTIEHPAEGEREAYETFIVDYWVAVPGMQRVALLTFSTTVPGERELLLQLFRVMVESLRWDQDSAGA
ncbi:MAG: hypothetical protein FWF16_03885 [Microbacteriaceae bacterium]|nr:hypothetical protein [Microbacteriaceae bacterium]